MGGGVPRSASDNNNNNNQYINKHCFKDTSCIIWLNVFEIIVIAFKTFIDYTLMKMLLLIVYVNSQITHTLAHMHI